MRSKAYSIQDELVFIRGLGNWSNNANVLRQPRDRLVAGYVRGVLRRAVGFDENGGAVTQEQLRKVNDEVLALCRRLDLPPTLEHVAIAVH